jgi:hypothetical protein
MGKLRVLDLVRRRGYVRPRELSTTDMHHLYELYRKGNLKRVTIGYKTFYYQDKKYVMLLVCQELEAQRRRRGVLYVEAEEEIPCLDRLAAHKYISNRGTTIYVIPR